jgi:hypothetical protein
LSASISLTTDTEVESYLGLAADTDATLIDALILAASERIERHCGRKFKIQEYTEYYSSDDVPDATIMVENPPITNSSGALVNSQAEIDASGLEVWDDADLAWDQSAQQVDSGNLVVIPDIGAVIVEEGLADGNYNSIKVVYYGGLSLTTAGLPDDLRMAANMVVATMYNRAKSRADGLRRESEEGLSAEYAEDTIPDAARAILDNYCREEL